MNENDKQKERQHSLGAGPFIALGLLGLVWLANALEWKGTPVILQWSFPVALLAFAGSRLYVALKKRW